jgi:cellobiose phosphorylase
MLERSGRQVNGAGITRRHPLGSAQNDEAASTPSQSWAVLSGAVLIRFAERAMDAVRTSLVARQSQVLLLLNPPSIARRRIPDTSKATHPARERRPAHHAAVRL